MYGTTSAVAEATAATTRIAATNGTIQNVRVATEYAVRSPISCARYRTLIMTAMVLSPNHSTLPARFLDGC